MRLKISKSKNVTLYYVIKTIYTAEKQKTITVKKLGNEQEVLKKSNGKDPVAWAKNYVDKLNKQELDKPRKIIIEKSQNLQIPNNISDIEDDTDKINKYKDSIFFKERWINENGLEQKFIVTYSLKYKNYQRNIRDTQIQRARKAINTKGFKIDKKNQNDFKRFITKINITDDGEIASKKVFLINQNLIVE